MILNFNMTTSKQLLELSWALFERKTKKAPKSTPLEGQKRTDTQKIANKIAKNAEKHFCSGVAVTTMIN